jgi:hypothetical protein
LLLGTTGFFRRKVRILCVVTNAMYRQFGPECCACPDQNSHKCRNLPCYGDCRLSVAPRPAILPIGRLPVVVDITLGLLERQPPRAYSSPLEHLFWLGARGGLGGSRFQSVIR